jgi:riboflavin kinase/FMN adenylyltransferase
MRVLRGAIAEWGASAERTAVVIGVFDGVHLGHRALIDRLDPSLAPAVLTFDPHPVEVLRPGTPPRLITTLEERLKLLDEAEVDLIGVLDLREIKEMAPETFVNQVLVDKFRVNQVVAGDDFRFGKDRAGDMALLRSMGGSHDFTVESIDLVERSGEAISSSRIRGLIETGHVGDASHLMGSWFTVTGRVIEGDKRGRLLGYPTANLRPPRRKVVPATGVYACNAALGDRRLHAAVNVGVRPTFGGGELLIEGHLLEFDEEIYGEELTLEFVEYLRPELKFDSVDDLIAQMRQDVSEAATILRTVPSRM